MGSIAVAESLIGRCSDGIPGLLVRCRVRALGGVTCSDDFVSDRGERGWELVAYHREGRFMVEPEYECLTNSLPSLSEPAPVGLAAGMPLILTFQASSAASRSETAV